MPLWLRQPKAWNVPVRARPMYWPCSIGVILALTLSPKASFHIEMISVLRLDVERVVRRVEVNSMWSVPSVGEALVHLRPAPSATSNFG